MALFKILGGIESPGRKMDISAKKSRTGSASEGPTDW